MTVHGRNALPMFCPAGDVERRTWGELCNGLRKPRRRGDSQQKLSTSTATLYMAADATDPSADAGYQMLTR